MKTRIEEATFRTADDVPITLSLVFYYEKFQMNGKSHQTLSVKTSLDGILPIEGWEDCGDLPRDFREHEQNKLRDYVRRFIELREASELVPTEDRKMIANSVRLLEEDA